MTVVKWYWIVLASTVLSFGSMAVGLAFEWITTWPSNLEFAAVFTSYICTLLCVHQTRWNYPVGVLTTFLYSWLFYQWEMYAVALFNLYLVFSLAYGWFRWGTDAQTLPVTRVRGFWWLGYVFLGMSVYGLLWGINTIFGVTITQTEIWITVLSGVAQFLLDNKKIETWAVWTLVNILSIWFFFEGGLYLVAFQYVFFLGNTVYGFIEWTKTMPVFRDFRHLWYYTSHR